MNYVVYKRLKHMRKIDIHCHIIPGLDDGAADLNESLEMLKIAWAQGFDKMCIRDSSGFTLAVYRNYGISLPHSSRAQANCGTKISVSEVQPGDLIFYGSGKSINHVAMYIGNGQVVHASNSRTGIIISNMYYRSPVRAARLIND